MTSIHMTGPKYHKPFFNRLQLTHVNCFQHTKLYQCSHTSKPALFPNKTVMNIMHTAIYKHANRCILNYETLLPPISLSLMVNAKFFGNFSHSHS